MEKIRLGIIGVGNMGSSHAKKVNRGDVPDFVLAAVADVGCLVIFATLPMVRVTMPVCTVLPY